jgi:hypothetical protein
MNESILSVLQCDGDQGRVVLVHRQSFGNSEVILRRESFSEDVGWFEQSRIELSPGQLSQLKQALGVLPATKARPTTQSNWGSSAPAKPCKSSDREVTATGRMRFALVS